MENKVLSILQSRKFWASIVGLLSVFGLYTGDAIASEELVNAILVIVGSYTLGTGIESGLQKN